MEAASRGAHEAGGMVVGLLPGTDRARANEYSDVTVVTGIGHARNLAVVATADVVVAVGGEWGTLSEIGLAGVLGRPVVLVAGWRLEHERRLPGEVHYAASAEEAVALAVGSAGIAAWTRCPRRLRQDSGACLDAETRRSVWQGRWHMAGMVALLLAVSAHAETGVGSGGAGSLPCRALAAAARPLPRAAATAPRRPAPAAPLRPVLTLFNAAPATASSTAPAARSCASRSATAPRSVRVRLAFVSLADGTTYRVNLGARRTRHACTPTRGAAPRRAAVPGGEYRVRITARNPRGKRAVRGTTVHVARGRPRRAAAHALPRRGRLLLRRRGRPLRRRRATATPTRARTSRPPRARRWSRRTPGVITWRAYQAARRRLLPRARRRRRALQLRLHAPPARQHAGRARATVSRPASARERRQHRPLVRPAPALRDLGRPVVRGRHAIDPLPFLKAWE